MKYRLLALFGLFVLAPVCIGADTVMLYVTESAESDYFKNAGLDYVAAVEDGVMDVFFNAGHIIFNYGLSSEPPAKTPFRADNVQARVAKSGGARFLIEVALSNPASESIAPAVIEYAYTDLILKEEITAGLLRLEAIDDGSITDERELCAAIGRAVALAALENG